MPAPALAPACLGALCDGIGLDVLAKQSLQINAETTALSRRVRVSKAASPSPTSPLPPPGGV